MPMIEPFTQIFFCNDVPLDNRYVNTLYFENRGSQEAYFRGKVVASMTNCTYQRQNSMIRASVPIQQLMNCNYLFFQNPDFEARFFFAFVNRVEYINNDVTAVYFEIDVMQTYLLDCTMRQCFIERGHTSVDEIGRNRMQEDLETGEYISIADIHTQALDKYVICVAAAVDSEGDPVQGSLYSRVYSGIKINVFEQVSEVNSYLDALTKANRIDAVVNIFMMPHTFQTEDGGAPKLNTFEVTKPYQTIDGYTPKNKKLFQYPYNLLHLTNQEGQSADFSYEDFSSDSCHFNVWGVMTCSPSAICVPAQYRGLQLGYEYRLSLDGWPQCSYNIDTYKAWLAQNANVMAWQDSTFTLRQRQTALSNSRSFTASIQDVIGSAASYAAAGGALGSVVPGLGTGVGATAGGIIGASMGLGRSLTNAYYDSGQREISVERTQSEIAGIMASRADHATAPPQAVGQTGSDVLFGLIQKGFRYSKLQIRKEYAKAIDDYFTMYGYEQHVVARPSLACRSRFTYVKTKGCNCFGNIPVWAAKSINDLFDKGITLWKDTAGVGNYEATNIPLGNGEY